MISILLCAALPFQVFIILCILLFHYKKSNRPLLSMAKIWILCLPLIILLYPLVSGISIDWIIPPRIQATLYAILLFIFLYYLYLQIFALVSLSISIRIMSQIALAKNHSIKIEELEKLYPFDELLKKKLDDAVKMGFIERTENAEGIFYINTPSTNKMAVLFKSIKQFLQWGKGG